MKSYQFLLNNIRFNYRLRHGLIGIALLGLFVVLFSIAVAYFLFNAHIGQQKKQLHLIAEKAVETFDHEMNIRAYSVISMRKTAEQYLTRRTKLSFDPIDYLQAIKDKNIYTLGVPAGYQTAEIGNITGSLPIPSSESVVAREMAMSIELLPLFQTVIGRDNDTPWVYYVSKNHFLNLYPSGSLAETSYTDALLDQTFFIMALPQNNPRREIFWTPPYQDTAGKGMMVTVASPVYEGDNFLGSIALDISLSKLTWLLDRCEFPNAQVYLYTVGGVYLAGSPNQSIFLTEAFRSGLVTKLGESEVTSFPLNSVPWQILVVTSHAEMIKSALWYAFPFAMVVFLLSICVMLLIALFSNLRKVRELSVHDGLTGLFNRRRFDEVLKIEWNRASRTQLSLSLAMLDIDWFKKYNDHYGHQAGDECLRRVADVLSAQICRTGDMVARYGGEEFVFIIPATHGENALTIARMICEAIHSLGLPHEMSVFGCVTASVGVASIIPAKADTPDKLIKAADEALYQAKELGRNQAKLA
jgi:diguanylate cyclase (GGDEF)-like protein